MKDKYFCADVSKQNEEELFGSVGPRKIWFLIHNHDAWKQKAFQASLIPEKVKEYLNSFTIDGEAPEFTTPSIVLIRTSDRIAPEIKKFYIVNSSGQKPWIRVFHWREPEDLLNLPIKDALQGEPVGEIEDNLFLVCTHGKRDKCCARYGMPLYTSLIDKFPGQVYRCSHVGGDRFAANVVCLPHGIFYGRMNIQTTPGILLAYQQRILHLDYFRGRSCFSKIIQAGEYYIRKTSDNIRLDSLEFKQHRKLGKERHEVVFREIDKRVYHYVELALRVAPFEFQLTCKAKRRTAPASYQLINYFCK